MDDALFSIEPLQRAEGLVLRLTGELDVIAREPLLREADPHLGRVPVIVDVSGAQFIDASIVGALFYLAGVSRDRGGRFVLVDGQSPPRSLWHHTRYVDVCPLYRSIQEATSALEE